MNIIKSRIAKSVALLVATALSPLPVAAVALGSTTSMQVPLPMVNFGEPARVYPVYVGSSPMFTGTWSPPAAPDWHGTFTGTGSPPAGAAATGISKLNFAGLNNNAGLLPVNSFFKISDLDAGSGSEKIILKAFDANGLITDPWLNTPDWVWGSTPAIQSSLPSYIWDPMGGTYTFDGAGVTNPNNPSINFAMVNLFEISQLEINDLTVAAGVAIGAPKVVPVPAAAWLFGSGLLGLVGIARRKKA